MRSTDKRDREFVDGVWSKVRYLEAQRDIEEERSIEIRNFKKKRMKYLSCFIIGIIILLIPALIERTMGNLLMTILAIYLLGFSSYYENYLI